MANSCVIKVTPAKLKEMADHYQPQLKAKTPPYSLFSAKVGALTITGYNSGKVMFQGAGAEEESAKWGNALEAKKTSSSTTSSTLPKDFATWSAAGSDEVGNGSYFGPVVVCATYVEASQMPLLRELGVKDSKELTDTQIREIAKDIKLVLPYRELVVTPEKYNQIQPEYNAVRMKVALHNQAIALLLEDIAPTVPQGILIDQFTPEGNYRKHLSREKVQVKDNLYFATKGEHHHLSVAAASIICRASFLDELDKASKELGMTIPSGAGTKSDSVAAKILKRGGMELLSKHAKLHFANTEKAKKKV